MPSNITLNMQNPTQKFIFGKDSDGLYHVVSAPLEFHRDINADFSKRTGKTLEELSGGYIEQSEDSFTIYGLSESFGAAPLDEVQKLLQQEGLKVDINSALDRSIKQENEQFANYLKGLESNFLQDVVKQVKEAGVLGGFDSIKSPTQISDNLATVIYSMENGGSFGFDTLYVGRQTEKGVVINPAIRQRWSLHSAEPSLNEELLRIDYNGDNGKSSIEFNPEKLSDEPIENSLNPADMILLNMYAEQTKRINAEGGPALINGRRKEIEHQYVAGEKGSIPQKYSYEDTLNHRGSPTPFFTFSYR